jgi:signal transduction histidine kinase
MTARAQAVTVVLTAVAVAALALMAARHGPFPAPADEIVLELFAGAVAVTAGVLVGRWRPGNGMAWLLVAAGAVILGGLLEWSNLALLFTVGGLLGGLEYGVLAHLLVSLPDGRLGTRVDRWIVGGFYLLVVASSVVPNLFFECRGAFALGCPGNLLVVRDDPVLVDRSELVFAVAGAVATLGLAGHLVRRWLAAGMARRRVLAAPYLAAIPIALVGLLDVLVWERHGQLAGFVRPLLLAVLPVAILLGALRSRARAGDVGRLLAVRDRREAGDGTDGLGPAIALALGDPSARLLPAVVPPQGDGDGVGHPARSRTPIVADGETLAVVDHDAALGAEPELLTAVLATAGLALRNERLAARVQAQLAEVRASRARLAAAQDEERRRIERDLHDGAQQLLVSVQLLLRLALEAGDGARDLVSEASSQLDEALVELRALARGVHPHLVTQRGLRAAVDTLADRAPLPVHVVGEVDRRPALVETTAYFVVAEALTNVARHARATHARVELAHVDGAVVVTVEDDGCGGARVGAGSGLVGLRDRVEAVGGELAIETPVAGGSRIRATLPAPSTRPAAPTSSVTAPLVAPTPSGDGIEVLP